MASKWDTLHAGKRKASKDLSSGVKKDEWYVDKNCRHFRNERSFASRQRTTMAEQVCAVQDEHARKRIQFATILHLLHEGRPMVEYSELESLFTFHAKDAKAALDSPSRLGLDKMCI